MGSVWRSQRLSNQAEVAVKLIDPEFVASKEAISRFRREAQAAEAIRSSHVVQILDYDIDEETGTPYIVMELLNGEDLSKRIGREQTLTPVQTATYLSQVAKAIALAHDHGIVHRDLKPENIFIVSEYDDEVVKVLDFGIARHQAGLGDVGGLHTKTGMILGTPNYMSPEQASGLEVTHLADVWSFALIAFECLTGRRVFSGGSFIEVGTAICRDPMPVPSTCGAVPEGFDAWFAQGAHRKLSERFQTIKAAAEALRVVCGQKSARSTSVSAPVESAAAAALAGTVHVLPVGMGNGDLSVGLPNTVSPASRSLLGVASPSRRRSKWLALSLTATIVVVGAAVGLRSLDKANKTVAPSSAAILPSIAAVTQPSSTADNRRETASSHESVAIPAAPAVASTQPEPSSVRGTSNAPDRPPPASAAMMKGRGKPKPAASAVAPAVPALTPARPHSPFGGID